jgi:zinc protease
LITAQRGPLPLVAIRLVILSGSASDPVGKHGLADMTAGLLRRGTLKRTADEINEAVEFVGGSLSIGATEDFMVLTITAPSEHLKAMIEVLADLVREPAFQENELESARARTLASFANDLDDPELIADRALLHAIWGDHPYGHDVQGSSSTVRNLTREDVVTFHRERMGPKISWLAVVGDIDPAQVISMAETSFGPWSGGPAAPVALAKLDRAALEGTVLLVNKPNQTQSQVRLGTLAFAKGHPDHPPAAVVDTALGGGFTSRLVKEIRVKRGLSYGAGSSFDRLKVGGTFSVSTFTKTESTREIIEIALAEVSKMRAKGPTPKEIANAQTYLTGLFPMRFETNESVAGAITDLRAYDLDDDTVERYRERIRAVTPKAAREVAGRYLFARPPVVVVVGKASEVLDQLKPFGPVKVVEVAEFE